jgi:methionyl-tRNA formyltransferase
MGSPKFAVPFLERLKTTHDIAGVVTQPDRPAGRGGRMRPPHVKVAAQDLDIPVYQPKSIATTEATRQLRAWAPDVIVVVAFGQLLPSSVLDLPPHGCLNVHASLLPRWRGAAPVPAAIIAGDEMIGATVMKMDEGLDTGPILTQHEEPIRPDDTTASILSRLAPAGAELLMATLPAYLTGSLVPRPQPSEQATYCNVLEKDDGRLDWDRSAVELDRQIRAVFPWPKAFTTREGQRVVIHRAAPEPSWEGSQPAGTVIPLGDGAGVATGGGALRLIKVQIAGKKALPIDAFLRGQRDFIGAVLGA